MNSDSLQYYSSLGKKKNGKKDDPEYFFCLRSLTASATLLTNECFSRYGQSSIIRLLRCAITHAVGCCACVVRDWRVLREVVTRVTRSLPQPPKKKKRLFCTSCYSHPSKTTNAFSRVLPCFPFFFLQTFSLIPAAFSSVTMLFLLFDSTDWTGTKAAENLQKTFLKIKGDRITTPQKGLLLLGERAQGFCFTWKRIQWSVNFSAQHNRTVETPLPRMQTIA